MREFYVAQYYNESEDMWEDCFSSAENNKNLKSEAIWAAVSKTVSGEWRIVKRSEEIVESGEE